MPDVMAVADRADMIVDGYAFIRGANGISVLNLAHPSRAVVYSERDEVLETSMDDIELAIVRDYLERNREFLGDVDA